MKCRYCASAIDDKAQFCTNCGMKIYQEIAPFQPTRAHGSGRKSGISDLLKGSVIGGVIGVILLIAGILAIVLSISSVLGSALDTDEGAGGIVDGILGGFVRMIVGAIMCAIGGTLMFWGFVGFVIGALGSR
jgi:zinc-ribbon domain